MRNKSEKTFLGTLCKRQHDHEGTGQSLRYRKGMTCCQCQSERAQRHPSSRTRRDRWGGEVDRLAAKAGKIALDGAPLPIALPAGLDDVAAWAERVRAERLNDTGRAAVDVLELYVRALVSHPSVEVLQRLGPVIDKLSRIGLQADAHESQRYLAVLRKKAREREAAQGEFGSIN